MSEGIEGNGKAGKADVRISQGRSPAYPYIDLEKAIERAQQVRAAGAARQAMPPETFYQIWKLGAQSSGARQTMAALNHFGLADYQSRGDNRKVKLSDLALKIVLDTQPVSTERDAAIKQAALGPTIHRELFEKYGPLLPADFVIQTYLVRDRGYNEQAAKSLISEYKDTLAFAGLDKPDNMHEPEAQPEDDPPGKVEVGDLVTVERDGALVFPKPVKVTAIEEHDGQVWVWTDGSEAWTEMETVTLEAKGGAAAKAPPPPPKPPAPPTPPAGMKPGLHASGGIVMRTSVFALPEGDVSLTYPAILSDGSLALLRQQIDFAIQAMELAKKAAPVLFPAADPLTGPDGPFG